MPSPTGPPNFMSKVRGPGVEAQRTCSVTPLCKLVKQKNSPSNEQLGAQGEHSGGMGCALPQELCKFIGSMGLWRILWV